MSSPLFNVTIQTSTLPGQFLYPKLAQAKLEDPMLQPVVERKGCQKVLGDMRDCLVETHCWGKCDEEVQRFQECINTKYFEEIVVEPEVEEIVAEHEVKSGEDSLESEVVDTIDEEVKSEGVVSTSDESGNELIDDVKTTEEEPLVNEEVKTNEEDSVVNEKVKTNEEEPVVNEEVKTSEEEPVVNEEVKTSEEEPVGNEEVKTSEEESLVTEKNTEDDSLDSNVDVNSLQDEKQEKPVITDDNAELVDDNDITKADETDTVDKDAFRIKIVSSSEKKVEEDENLLFRVTIKPNV